MNVTEEEYRNYYRPVVADKEKGTEEPGGAGGTEDAAGCPL